MTADQKECGDIPENIPAVPRKALICRVRGHRCRFGAFDRKVIAHDLVCIRCGLIETAQQVAALIKDFV